MSMVRSVGADSCEVCVFDPHAEGNPPGRDGDQSGPRLTDVQLELRRGGLSNHVRLNPAVQRGGLVPGEPLYVVMSMGEIARAGVIAPAGPSWRRRRQFMDCGEVDAVDD